MGEYYNNYRRNNQQKKGGCFAEYLNVQGKKMVTWATIIITTVRLVETIRSFNN